MLKWAVHKFDMSQSQHKGYQGHIQVDMELILTFGIRGSIPRTSDQAPTVDDYSVCPKRVEKHSLSSSLVFLAWCPFLSTT